MTKKPKSRSHHDHYDLDHVKRDIAKLHKEMERIMSVFGDLQSAIGKQTSAIADLAAKVKAATSGSNPGTPPAQTGTSDSDIQAALDVVNANNGAIAEIAASLPTPADPNATAPV